MAKKKENIEEKLMISDVNLDRVKNELTEYVDQKINKLVDDKVRKEIINEIDKANKRVIREKNRKIFYRNIVILILVAALGFLTYLLYDDGYFDKYFNKSKVKVVENKSNTKKETKEKKEKNEKKEPTLDELKEKYGYLIDKIYINENSDYLSEYYDGNLTSELKNYLAFNLIDVSKLQDEDDYNMLDTDDIKEKYESLFNDKYESKTFKYNGNIIRYINKMDSYITEEKVNKTTTNIRREITKIEVKDEEIKITTIEGKVNDDKVYNVLSGDELGEYNDNLSEYNDKLNHITYVFKDSKLISIEK